MRLKKLVVIDPDKLTVNQRLIQSIADYSAAETALTAATKIYGDRFLKLDETEWKKFIDVSIYFASKNAQVTSSHQFPDQELDYVQRHQLRDFDYTRVQLLQSKPGPSEPSDPETLIFSIVIPFRDRDHTLPRVLQNLSRLKADFPFEVILVDDGSKKQVSGEVLKALQTLSCAWSLHRLPPSKLFRAGFARNCGARAAKGKYLVFIDSDILVAEDFLTQLHKELGDSDLVQAKRWQLWRDEPKTTTDFSFDEPNPFWRDFNEEPSPWMTRPQAWRSVSTYCLTLARDKFIQLGGFRIWYSSYGFEDTDLGFRAFQMGLRFRRGNLDVLHLSPLKRSEGHAFRGRKKDPRLTLSARKYFLLNQAHDSLPWLAKIML